MTYTRHPNTQARAAIVFLGFWVAVIVIVSLIAL